MNKKAISTMIELMITLSEIEEGLEDFADKVTCEINNPNSYSISE